LHGGKSDEYTVFIPLTVHAECAFNLSADSPGGNLAFHLHGQMPHSHTNGEIMDVCHQDVLRMIAPAPTLHTENNRAGHFHFKCPSKNARFCGSDEQNAPPSLRR
jgi:hypothetical protein